MTKIAHMDNVNAVAAIVWKIGNVTDFAEVDGILYTLASDAVVRVNDIDSGLNAARVLYPSFAAAHAGYVAAVAAAVKAS